MEQQMKIFCYQSAFRTDYNSVTALLKTTDDIVMAQDQNKL